MILITDTATEIALLRVACACVAVLVLVGCICRLERLDKRYHNAKYIALYALMGLWAGARLIEAMQTAHGGLDWVDLAGLVAGALHIHLTLPFWRGGRVPSLAERSNTHG